MDELIKHSSFVQMSADLNLNQRRSYNVMLANAFPDLIVQETHMISFARLSREIGSNTYNYEYIHDYLLDMLQKKVVFNLFDRDKDNAEVWRVHSHLFADLAFHGNLVEYSYSPKIRQYLSSPNLYIKLGLAVQKEFSCQYTVPVYEFLLDMLGGKRQYCTVHLSVEDFKLLTAVNGIKLYEQFKFVNDRVLKPAIKEINAPHTALKVETSFKKEGRRVVKIVFEVSRKKTINAPPVQPSLQLEADDIQKEIVEYFGVPPNTATKWRKEYSDSEIVSAMAYVKTRAEKKSPSERKLMKLGGYLRKALQEGYATTDPLIQKTEQQKLERQQQKAFIEHRIKRTTELYEALSEGEQQQFLDKFIANLSPSHKIDYQLNPDISTNKMLKSYYYQYLADKLLKEDRDVNLEAFIQTLPDTLKSIQ